MNVIFEKKDELNGTISVNVSGTDYAPEVDKKLKQYQKQASIPGFRPGMAPKSMIEKMYGSSVLLEAINTTASNGLFNYIEENKLNILGQPVLTEDTKIDELEKGKDYTFRFDIGLAPDFTLNISTADVFTKYNVTVSETMIDEEVDRMRKRMGTLHDVEIAGDNDMVYVTLSELDENGQPIEGGVKTSATPILTSTIKNEAIKNEFIGATKGKSFDVNIFDLFDNDSNEIAHVLGINKLTVNDISKNFNVLVEDIKRNTEAEINQELFDKIYGPSTVDSLEAFRERIKTEVAGYYNSQTEHLFEHELVDALVAKQNITLPDEFLKRWLVDRHADKFNADNVEHNYQHEAEYLRKHLFEEKVLSENNVQVGEEEIKQAAISYTKSMFGAYGGANGLSDEMLLSIVEPSLKKEDYRSRMINLAVSNKVREIVKGKITIETKEIDNDTFVKIITEHNQKHHHNHE
jgi:trigger factor